MAHEFKRENNSLIYILCDVEDISCKKIYKKDIVYVGETNIGFSRLSQHTAKKHANIWCNDVYVRSYHPV